MPGVSVVICTYNGSPVIRLALEALAAQDFDGPAEIILVDNNSTDGVAAVAAEFWQSNPDRPFALRLAYEERRGLAFARRTGVRSAKHELILFCDDDNLLAPNYLSAVSSAFDDPALGAIGGGCTPVSEVEFPPFFYTYAFRYAVGSPELEPGPVNERRGWLYGAGLSVRKSDLLAIYESASFPLLTGRRGADSGASGEDIEICYSLRLLGRTLVYDDRLLFRHFISPERLSRDYIGRIMASDESGASVNKLYRALLDLDQNRTVGGIARRAMRLAFSVLRGKPDTVIAFWILSAFGLERLMNSTQLKVFRHYRYLRQIRNGGTSRKWGRIYRNAPS